MSWKANLLFLPVLVAGLMISNVSVASDSGSGEFNAGEMIAHHIADAHSIHIVGDFSIPLPVILYTNKGIEVFMSSKFWDEHHHVVPYTSESTGNTYVLQHEKIYYAGEAGAEPTERPLDFSITKSIFGLLMILTLMVIMFRAAAKGYSKRKGQAPKGIQNLMEPLILFIRDEVAIPSIGAKKADRFTPFLLSVFFFIWMCNLLGLVPFLGGFNITGTLSITIVLAFIVFIITTVSANKHYWGHILWPPGVPIPIKFILVPIEFAQVFIKPAVLMVRLTANIAAGHIVILAFVSLVILFGKQGDALAAGFGVGVGATLFMIFMFFIELLVAFLQAYVFTLLAALYFGDATQEAHH